MAIYLDAKLDYSISLRFLIQIDISIYFIISQSDLSKIVYYTFVNKDAIRAYFPLVSLKC